MQIFAKKRSWLLTIITLLIIIGLYQTNKTLPEGLNQASSPITVSSDDVRFFRDYTYQQNGERVLDQQIFDEVLVMIDNAQTYILVDLFFYSDFLGVETEADRYLARELTDALIAKKTTDPDVTIQVITDPINVMYGGHRSADFVDLEEAGIPVIVTDVRPLRDSNPAYSSVWRLFFQWFGNNDKPGYLPNPLDQKSQKLGVRTYLNMLNYKANHRKVIVTDFLDGDTQGLRSLITSANPHDGSSAHSNIAVQIDHYLADNIVRSEAAVAALSNHTFIEPDQNLFQAPVVNKDSVTLQLLTEESIEDAVIDAIDQTQAGDFIDLAMFYIADREIITSLKSADDRGVEIQILLDPNKDAFGREKNGVPNRQVAHELKQHTTGNTQVRWCNTSGEQCHSKLLLVQQGSSTTLIQGSANYTRRNLDNYNLETNIAITGSSSEPVIADAHTFFTTQWNNENGIGYSVPYETYADTSLRRTITYRLKEATGLSRW